MQELVNDAGKLAGSISAIVGLLALLLVNPIRKAVLRRRDAKRREQEQRLAEERASRAEDAAFRQEMRTALSGINQALVTLTDDIGDLQYERLSQAHEYYAQQGWCPSSKKEMLCQMHKSYRAKGRNHLSEHYEEEILHLASKPPEPVS